MEQVKTWQDFLEIGASEKERMNFCLQVINDHKSDPQTIEAAVAERYYDGENVTITNVNKFIVDAYGKMIPDIWSPNHKIKCHLYPYFITQQVLFLLGNGISFTDSTTLTRLGKGFEKTILDMAIAALNGGIAFGFWNLDHLDKFKLTEFAPLYDEETGRLMAGVRYWQLTPEKPLRLTFFEPDGYTEYIKRKDAEIEVFANKRPYVQTVVKSSTGVEIAEGESYPGLPIIPLYTHNRRSAIAGNRDALDAYDLIASKLVNNIDNGEFIYWIIKNAPYMADDPEELQAFLQKLKTSGVVAVGDGQEVEAHQIETPINATDSALDFMRKQLFADFMAFDPLTVAGGADTATQIKAMYEPLNEKIDLFEYQVTEFIENLLELIGIDDKPTYTRSMITNKQEEAQTVMQAATFTDEDYTTRKLLEIFGDADKVDDVLKRRDEAEITGFAATAITEGGTVG